MNNLERSLRAFFNGLTLLLLYSLLCLVGIAVGTALFVLKAAGFVDVSWWWVAACFAPLAVGLTAVKLLEFFGRSK